VVVVVATSLLAWAGPVQQLISGGAGASPESVAGGHASLPDARTVTNERPIASIVTAPAAVVEGQPVQFTDASTDADGAIVSWLWAFGDGSQAYEADPTHAYPTPGTYEVRLYVVDDQGRISEAARELLVVQSTPPTASFRVAWVDQATLELVDESRTPGSGGEIVHIGWDFGDGAVQAGSPMPNQQVTHTYETPGTYEVTLYVVDAAGKMGIAKMQVTVTSNVGAGLPPVAEDP